MTQPQPVIPNHGIIKQIISGDTLVIRGRPKAGPPPEKQLSLSHVSAPRLARRATNNLEETKDEPLAWESREFLRKELIGQDVVFVIDHKVPSSNKEYGTVFLGKDLVSGKNMTEAIVSEGLVTVKRESIRSGSDASRLLELEDSAKSSSKGKWGADAQSKVRDVKWSIPNPRNFVDKMKNKPIPAVIEHVRDGSTVRAFLLPEFYHITLMVSGIRSPMFKVGESGQTSSEPFAEEAKYFTESRLLQRDCEIILESVNNNNFIGTIIHPNGNIAEGLLRAGLAKCVDWSMAFVAGGPEKLRTAEKFAKENKVRIWKDYVPSTSSISAKDKEFTGVVVEVVNGDALVVKLPDSSLKKIFFASIRPPRLPEDKQDVSRSKGFRPLYDIPFMYEAREFLRKKLIGSSVKVVVDYIQPASSDKSASERNFPEKVCCSIFLGGINVGEALVARGLATVVRYRQDDDQRSSHYDELLAAEMKAQKSKKGLHSSKELSTVRITDISGDVSKAKQFLPSFSRANRMEAVVEFVASGSRMRVHVPRENCLITFLLGGINCPRPQRPMPGGQGFLESEPWGNEALAFTKELCLQKEVEIEIETMDKGGNFIGWMFVDKRNLSLLLVEESFASVHFSAERSPYGKALQVAEDQAKANRGKIWKDYVEEQTETTKVVEDTSTDRSISYKKVVVCEVTEELHIFTQSVDQGPQLEQLMSDMRVEFAQKPPLTGAYRPKKGDICAAKYSQDNDWYRARVEKVTGNQLQVLFIDYGNRETTDIASVAALTSPQFVDMPAFASEYALGFVKLPKDPDYRDEALDVLKQDCLFKPINLNVEYKMNGIGYVTLVNPESSEDTIMSLVKEGYLLVESRREKRLQGIVTDYKAAEESARKNHCNVWQYGDVTDDEASEFGLGR